VPSFSFPEPAAVVIGHMVAYRRWLDTEAEATMADLPGVDSEVAASVLARAVSASTDGDRAASMADVDAVLHAYGVQSPTTELTEAADTDAIVAVAERVGYPVGLKALRRRAGRSAEAGVALDLPDADAVRDAATVMRASLGDDASCITVQQMVPPGIDVRIRCTTDPRLGAVITVGLGGIMADAIGDEASRLAPVTHAAASNLVNSSRVGAALAAAGIDAEPLVDTITRVSHLVFEHTAIDELDINPAIIGPSGCWVVDAKVTIAATTQPEAAMRRLV
jgi:acyl-CoA synthetase (NDP forming)